MDRIYMCIDLKSFYASVECVERGLDPFKVNLVVADPSRGTGGICLAITPAMKKLGIHNRCRIFEIPSDVKYITALPRMKKYMEISAKIYSIYLKYISKDDIHIYSIDECFFDATDYVGLYNIDAFKLAKMITDDIYKSTGISATAGIGTNLFLAKVALDITAKKNPSMIGYLDEKTFKDEIWHHKPITDIWGISRGTANRLLKYDVHDLYGITTIDEELLYKEFGINAEILIDHANGIEPCKISDIKKYKSKSNSLSNGQILFENYKYDDALLVLKEMVDMNVLNLVEKKLVTNSIGLYIGYSDNSHKGTGGSRKLDGFTQSRDKLMEAFVKLFEETTVKDHLIRRINIGFGNVIGEEFETMNLFDFEEEASEKKQKEKDLQNAINGIKTKYGKNSILKGMNLYESATTIKRNKLIGGHNSGEE